MPRTNNPRDRRNPIFEADGDQKCRDQMAYFDEYTHAFRQLVLDDIVSQPDYKYTEAALWEAIYRVLKASRSHRNYKEYEVYVKEMENIVGPFRRFGHWIFNQRTGFDPDGGFGEIENRGRPNR